MSNYLRIVFRNHVLRPRQIRETFRDEIRPDVNKRLLSIACSSGIGDPMQKGRSIAASPVPWAPRLPKITRSNLTHRRAKAGGAENSEIYTVCYTLSQFQECKSRYDSKLQENVLDSFPLIVVTENSSYFNAVKPSVRIRIYSSEW